MTLESGDGSKVSLLRATADRTRHWPFQMWGFGEGVALRGLLAAYRSTGHSCYLEFVRDLLKAYAGRGATKSNQEHIAPGTELLLLYESCGDRELLETAKELATLNASFPRNEFGASMHRPDLSGWRRQIWVDCIDVDAPFLVRLGRITGEEDYVEQGLREILGYARALQAEGNDGLFWHGYETHCGNNGQLWARGNGWALMGLVETLRLLPEENPNRKELWQRLHSLCQALQRYQHPDGLWHTLITQSETYLESTLAIMTAVALREAFSAMLLEESEFGTMEQRARDAAKRCLDEEGSVGLVSEATPIGEARMYATRPFGIYPWGQGPMLLMLTQ